MINNQKVRDLRQIGRWFDPNRRSHFKSLNLNRLGFFVVGGMVAVAMGCEPIFVSGTQRARSAAPDRDRPLLATGGMMAIY